MAQSTDNRPDPDAASPEPGVTAILAFVLPSVALGALAVAYDWSLLDDASRGLPPGVGQVLLGIGAAVLVLVLLARLWQHFEALARHSATSTRHPAEAHSR